MPYLITISTYGTHLPGDRRGSTDRHYGRLPPASGLRHYAQSIAKEPPFLLDTPQSRRQVKEAILNVCQHREWRLLALHVRTTHLHAIVSAPISPEKIIATWKAYATRTLKTTNQRDHFWTRGADIRHIHNEGLPAALHYVLRNQGNPMEIHDATTPSNGCTEAGAAGKTESPPPLAPRTSPRRQSGGALTGSAKFSENKTTRKPLTF